MAKACSYLCRQCRFIDGFGEFGEYFFISPCRDMLHTLQDCSRPISAIEDRHVQSVRD